MDPQLMWNTNPVCRVSINGEVITLESPLTAEALCNAVKERGIRKFFVEDKENRLLSSNDFPYNGDSLVVREYNEAK